MQISQLQNRFLFSSEEPLLLECGSSFSSVEVAFETYGTLNASGDNAILVCHALSGSAQAAAWWDPMIGPGRALDTQTYFVICSNILGSCYGTTGPTSVNPFTGVPYRSSFPAITVRDMVRVQKRLMDAIGVRRLASVIGSSLGGMQVLEWGVLYPDFCKTMIPISVAARQTAWCIALGSAARAAIRLDPIQGLSLARMIGMISYRSPEEFEERFGRRRRYSFLSPYDPCSVFEIESYLSHQGQKLVERFDAETYLCLSRAMDLHDVASGRGDLDQVLGGIRAKTLCIGVSSDIRYPPANQKELVRRIPGAVYGEIESIHGHDAFLIEFEQLGELTAAFLADAMAMDFEKASGWR